MLRFLGRSDKQEDSSTSRRKEESRTQRKESEPAASSTSARKQSRGDDRDRGFNPTSTSFSTSSRSPYPGGAAPSVASSYATAQAGYDGGVAQPTLVENFGEAASMPRVRSDRDDKDRDGERDKKSSRRRERSSSRDRKGHRRERSRSEDRGGKADKRDKKPKRRSTITSVSDNRESTRAGEMETFNAQIGGAGFSQFPGQVEGMSGGFTPANQGQHPPTSFSNHVPDMFPGQFPAGASAPYRPPLAKNEGGPGLAADYYGDLGQSVASQPGVRTDTPSLIVGTEPHLMMASSQAAPPPEPSSVGQVGASASFFSGATFEPPNTSPKPGPQARPNSQDQSFSFQGRLSPAIPIRPSVISQVSPMTSSTAIPSLGAAAMGAAASYAMSGTHSSQHQQSSTYENSQSYGRPASPTSQPSFAQPGLSSSSARPPKSGKQSTSTNIPYAAAAAGAAGLAAAAYHHDHHDHNNSYSYSSGAYPSGATMAQQHRHSGPLSKIADFFRDPDGVARFEEYTEYIGVCRGCFEPGSSPRDAPRKHHYSRRRSSEKLRASTRVDKENRYYVSSDGESRRKNNKSWLAATAAGIGLASVGKSMFGDARDFNDTYSVKSGKLNGSTTSVHRPTSPTDYRRFSSKDGLKKRASSHFEKNVEYGIAADGSAYRKGSQSKSSGDAVITTYIDSDSRRKRSCSRSRERSKKARDAALGAAAGVAVASAISKHGTSSDAKVVRIRHRSRSQSVERRSRRKRQSPGPSPGIFGGFFTSTPSKSRDGRRRKEEKGFFSLSNASSSSSDAALAFGGSTTHLPRTTSKRASSPRIKSTADANAALIGLGAAAAALAAHDNRSKTKGKRVPNVVAVKEAKPKQSHHNDHKHAKKVEDDVWESASEDEGYLSVDSALAFGLAHRRSHESLSDSGTDKWDWRWGQKKQRGRSGSQHSSQLPSTTTAAAAGLAGVAAGTAIAAGMRHRDSMAQSTESMQPMQHVYPVSTSDPSNYDVMRHDPVTGQQPISSRPDPVPLQQPRPIVPVPSAVYTSQAHDYFVPSNDVVGYAPQSKRFESESKSKQGLPGSFPDDRESRRRESSPPTVIRVEPKGARSRDENSGVRFDLTKEQEKKHTKEDRSERRRSEKSRSEAERREAEEQAIMEQERRDSKQRSQEPRRESERRDERRQDKRASTDEYYGRQSDYNDEEQSRRHAEMERELKRLAREEPPASRPRSQTKSSDTAGLALAGVAAAAIAAAASHNTSSSAERQQKRKEESRGEKKMPIEVIVEDDIRPSKKSKPKKGGFASIVGNAMAGEASQARNDDDWQRSEAREDFHHAKNTPQDVDSKSQERKLAEQAVAKIRIQRAPSPVVHESYASYFAPDDILSKPATAKQTAPDPNADVDIQAYNVRINTTRSGNGRFIDPEIPSTPGEEFAPIETHQYLPWRVPYLNLINPTPPVSRAGSWAGSAKPSPVIKPVQPSIIEEDEDVPESPKEVTSSNSHPHGREVPVHEEHKESVTASQSYDHPSVKYGSSAAVNIESPVEEIKRSSIPGAFEDDLDFAATLAAGAEQAGFDPNIVIDNDTYRRRESPPGSQSRTFYQQPFYQTVSDIAMDSPRSRGAPPQRGWVEDGELPATPKEKRDRRVDEDESKHDSTDPDLSRQERRKKKGAKRRSKDQSPVDTELPLTPAHELEYTQDPDDAELEIIEDAARGTTEDFGWSQSKKGKKKKSKRSSTIDGSSIAAAVSGAAAIGLVKDTVQSSRSSDYESKKPSEHHDPRDVPLPEDTSSLASSAKTARTREEEPEELYESPNEYAASAATAPLDDDRGESRKHKKRSKRRSGNYDDTASVVSSPAKFDETKESSSKSKKEKKGGLFGLFGRSSEDTSDKRLSKDMTPETADEVEERGKKHKKSRRRTRDSDDFYSIESSSVADLSKLDETTEDRKSRAKDERRRSRHEEKEDGDSGRPSQDLSAKVPILASALFLSL